MSGKTPILFGLQKHPLMPLLAAGLSAETGELGYRHFPDGESYVRVMSTVAGRHCVVVAELSNPDTKFLPLAFLTATLRELNAASIGLVAPYLSYMRQDRRFAAGEAITSRIFSELLSRQVDWMVTVDPHLHRYGSLDEIYSIPTRVVQAAPLLAQWLQSLPHALLVGPDSESEQWVANIAALSGHTYVIGDKQRHGDRDVQVTLPDLPALKTPTAVIIDDVIASGNTVIQCARALQQQGLTNIHCASIHGVFANNADKVLLQNGISRLVTCNTIPHYSNAIDVADSLLVPVNEFLHS